MPMSISPEQVKQFEDDGFVIVENLFTTEELQPVIAELEGLVEEFADEAHAAGKLAQTYRDYPFGSRLAAIERELPESSVLIHNGGELRPNLARLWSSEKLLDIVEKFVGPDIAGHPIWCIRPKTPRTERMTVPWHQDTAYLAEAVEYTVQVAAWIPLVDVDANNGCMQVVRGGHRPSQVLDHKLEREVGNRESWYLYIDERDIARDSIVTCEMKVGSVLFLHNMIPHRSLENHSDGVRWSVDLRYQDPAQPSGMATHTEEPMVMRKADDPTFKIDWAYWTAEFKRIHDSHRGRIASDKFDTTVDGVWLERWK